MGGFGSGRYGFASAKCEEYRRIDLAWLRRNGYLHAGNSGNLTWSRGGNKTGSINYRVETGGLRLIYRTRPHGGEWHDVNELVPFVWTQTRFGGQRRWFQCMSCGRRCRILYGGSHYRCRRCHGLKYESQYEPAYQRAIDQVDKLRARVGGERGAFDEEPFPPKPKGMHWKTYRRLEERYDALQGSWTVGVMQRFGLYG